MTKTNPIINENEFAMNVMQSTSVREGTPEFIAEQKLEIYLAAYEQAKEHNSPILARIKAEKEKESNEYIETLSKLNF